MGHVGHPIRRVAIEPLELVLARTHDHQVGTDVEFLISGSAFRPGAHIHICDANSIRAWRAPGTAVLNPAQEDTIEARRLIVGKVRVAWQAGPLVRART